MKLSERFINAIDEDSIISGKNAHAIEDAVNFIRKYEDAEEQGRLVILPCKVGDKVRDKIADHIFTIQTVELGHKAGTLFRCGNPGTDDYAAFYDFEIGERFDILGHEEAEAALKEGQDDGT